MNTFKQFLAYPIYGTIVWLVWVLGRQTGIDGAAALLIALLLVPFVIWLWSDSKEAGTVGRVLAFAGILVSCIAIVGLVRFSDAQYEIQGSTASDGLPWETYSDARLAEYQAADLPVFVNFTAAWCVTCLVNEKVALNANSVRALFRDRGIRYLKSDWTRRDPMITEALSRFGRSGVPLYLFYSAGSRGVAAVLPQILTPGTLLKALGGMTNGDT